MSDIRTIPALHTQFPQHPANLFVMTNPGWATDQGRRIGDALRKLRGDRSGLWLSNETAKAGHRVSRTTISELESGKRKSVTTAELCVLAWVLKVPPIQLLYPDLPDGQVEIVPGEWVSSIVAATWFGGETTFEPELDREIRDGADREEFRASLAPSRGARLIRLSRERLSREEEIKWLSKTAARMSDEPEVAKQFVDRISGEEARISAINRELLDVDGAVVSSDG